MSDNELKALYTETGVGTGKFPQVDQPVDETEVVESKQALRNLTVSLALTLFCAVGAFIEVFAPAISHIVMAYLPAWIHVSPEFVMGLLSSLAFGIQKRAMSKHKVAVVKAMVTEPSSELKAAYNVTKKTQ